VGLDFLAEVLARETARHPENLDALSELGHVYTRLGRYQDGLSIDRELVRRAPGDATAHYNLACSLALLGTFDEALRELEAAVELGYDDLAHLLGDDDLASLRALPRFLALVRALQGDADA
jgi:tetratricopeptide (TPR) repeat protein